MDRKRFAPVIILVTVAFFSVVAFSRASIAYADGTNESPPCWPLSSCGSFNHSAVMDLSALNDQFVVVMGNGNLFCGPTKYSIVPENRITVPSLDDYSSYFAIEKTYFDKAGGVAGLFSKQSSNGRCDVETLAPKDLNDLDQHSLGLTDFLVPKNDLIFSRSANKTIGDRFIGVSSISAWGKGPDIPSPITDKSHFYRPAGWYCDGVTCRLIMQRYKEVWTLDNGTTEEHPLQVTNISGLQPASSSIGFFTRYASIDLNELKDKFVLIESSRQLGPRGDHYCGNEYSVVPENQFNTSKDNSYYFLLDKSYFDKVGGISGLFFATSTPAIKECAGMVDLRPNNPTDFDQHIITLSTNYYYNSSPILVPQDDDVSSEYFDKDAYRAMGGTATNLVAVQVPTRWIGILPSKATNESYFYSPAGYYCDNVKCELVVQRYKEIWTLADGTTEEHILATSTIDGLRPLTASPFPNGSAITPMPAPQPILIPPPPPAQATSVPPISVVQPQAQSPQPPAPQLPQRSFLGRIWCFIKTLFGGSCN